jgi:hypothetical protein
VTSNARFSGGIAASEPVRGASAISRAPDGAVRDAMRAENSAAGRRLFATGCAPGRATGALALSGSAVIVLMRAPEISSPAGESNVTNVNRSYESKWLFAT